MHTLFMHALLFRSIYLAIYKIVSLSQQVGFHFEDIMFMFAMFILDGKSSNIKAGTPSPSNGTSIIKNSLCRDITVPHFLFDNLKLKCHDSFHSNFVFKMYAKRW